MGARSRTSANSTRGGLRARAESRVKRPTEPVEVLTRQQAQELVHELRVHQIELEMQNEELRKAQEEIEESRENYVDLFDFAPVGYLTVGKGSVILEINLTGARLLGIARRDLIGRIFTQFLAPEHIDIFLQFKVRALAGQEGQKAEFKIVKGDGAAIWVALEGGAAKSGREPEPVLRLALSDITEQRRLEQAERRSQKLEALGTMAGGIAHDLNNIMTPILLNLEVALLETPENAPLRSYLETAFRAARRGKELVGQIVTFSRQKESAGESLRVGPVISEILSFLRPAFPETIKLRQELCGKLDDSVLADPGQIQQIILNICNNAVSAMKPGGGVLKVGLEPMEVGGRPCEDVPGLVPGPYLRLSVSDTGSGMTPEVLEKAFDPFFTTKRPGEGSGMGLAVVASIVKTLRGTITARSEPGKGSVFEVYLPRAGSLARKPLPAHKPRGGRESLLYVEDDPDQIKTLQAALGRLGYRVRGVDGSTEALAVFRDRPDDFDLVITDQRMPGMSGLHLAEEILKLRPEIPIILCTGYSEEADADRARAAGVTEFLMKPFTISDLSAGIRRALRGHPPDRVNRSG